MLSKFEEQSKRFCISGQRFFCYFSAIQTLVFKKLSAAISFCIVVEIIQAAKLTGPAVLSGIQMPVDDNSGAQTSSDGQAHKIAERFALPKIFFPDGKTIGIVIHENGFAKALLQKVF